MATSPTHIVLVVAAVAWPLAGGLALVLWSKLRSAAHARRVAAMEGDLRQLYRTVEGRGAPAHLAMVVDALEEGEALAGDRSRADRPAPARTA
jgi:hypothetical protein